MSVGYRRVQGAASLVVKASDVRLYAFKVRNRNGATRYAMLLDLAVLPSNGALTGVAAGGPVIESFVLAATSELYIPATYFHHGISCPAGLVIAISTADSDTLTLATAADHDISAVYD